MAAELGLAASLSRTYATAVEVRFLLSLQPSRCGATVSIPHCLSQALLARTSRACESGVIGVQFLSATFVIIGVSGPVIMEHLSLSWASSRRCSLDGVRFKRLM